MLVKRSYTEALRVAERILDHQHARLVTLRADADRLTKLGVAALAGTLAAAGLLVQADASFTSVPRVALAAGVLGTVVAIARANAGNSEATLGPRIEQVYAAVGTEESGVEDLQFALLELSARAERHNDAALAAGAAMRREATWLLLVGAAMLLGAFAYVLGGSIYA